MLPAVVVMGLALFAAVTVVLLHAYVKRRNSLGALPDASTLKADRRTRKKAKKDAKRPIAVDAAPRAVDDVAVDDAAQSPPAAVAPVAEAASSPSSAALNGSGDIFLPNQNLWASDEWDPSPAPVAPARVGTYENVARPVALTASAASDDDRALASYSDELTTSVYGSLVDDHRLAAEHTILANDNNARSDVVDLDRVSYSTLDSTDGAADGELKASYEDFSEAELKGSHSDLDEIAAHAAASSTVSSYLFRPHSVSRSQSSPNASAAAGTALASHSATSLPLRSVEATIDWNGAFQAILDLPERDEADLLVKYERLSSLAHDFVDTAQRVGTMIISEAFLDEACKTLKPTNMGGQAGGEKWNSMGIMFKFAVDWKSLYKGDAWAMKAAGHELKSLMRYYQVEGLRVPLMALIDYRGFRLVAQSMLPITTKSLVYGSSDAGITMHNSDPLFAEKMERAARQLNIKGHLCGRRPETQVLLHAPADIEGHVGVDGRHYVLDFARVFPPTCEDSNVSRTFLFKLMRPEWVAQYRSTGPLSSDAFSPFSSARASMSDVDNREVYVATMELLNNRVPSFAKWFDEQMRDEHYATKVAPKSLAETIHRQGINCRYLGRIRAHCTNAAARTVLLVEITARVVKNMLRERLRTLARSLRVPGEMPYRKEIVRMLNVVLGHGGKESERFWRSQLREQMQVQFSGALSPEEAAATFDLRAGVSMYSLLKRLQRVAAISLTKRSLSELKHSSEPFRVVLPDIANVTARVKHMNIVSYAEGMSLYLASKREANSASGRRLFRLAESKFDSAVESTPDNEATLNTFAQVLREHAARETHEDSMAQYAKALEKFRMARNWEAIGALGHHLIDTFSHHWRDQDAILELASSCFSLLSAVAPELGQRSLGRVKVTRAALRRDDALYAAAGSLFASDLGGLGAAPEHLQWLSTLQPAEVAAVAEVLQRSPSLERFDSRWITHSARHCSSRMLRALWLHAQPKSLVVHVELPLLPRPEADEPPPALLSAHHAGDEPPLIDAELLVAVAAQPGRLEQLHLLGLRRVPEEAVAHLLDRCGASLRDLSLAHGAEVSSMVYDAIGTHCGQLLHLNLSGTAQSVAPGPASVASLTKAMRHVTHLDVTHTQWPAEHYETLVRSAPQLTHVALDGCATVSQLAFDALANAAQLLSLSARGCPGPTEVLLARAWPLLERFASDSLDDTLLRSFLLAGSAKPDAAKGGWRANQLRALDVSGSRVTDASIKLLATDFGQLEELLVAGCAGVSAPVVAEAVVQVYDRLRVLDVSDVGGVGRAALLSVLRRGFPALRVLRLGRVGTPDTSVSDEALGWIAQGCSGLEELSLRGCRDFTDAGVRSLSVACTRLQRIDLSHCPTVTRPAIVALADHCHDVRSLNLAFCRLVGDISCVAAGMPLLQHLDLHECSNVADVAVIRIASTLPALQYLDICACRRLTDRAVAAIQHHCPELRVLVLGSTTKTSDPQLRELCAARPGLLVYAYGAKAIHTSTSTRKTPARHSPAPLSSSSRSALASSETGDQIRRDVLNVLHESTDDSESPRVMWSAISPSPPSSPKSAALGRERLFTDSIESGIRGVTASPRSGGGGGAGSGGGGGGGGGAASPAARRPRGRGRGRK